MTKLTNAQRTALETMSERRYRTDFRSAAVLGVHPGTLTVLDYLGLVECRRLDTGVLFYRITREGLALVEEK